MTTCVDSQFGKVRHILGRPNCEETMFCYVNSFIMTTDYQYHQIINRMPVRNLKGVSY